MQKIGMDYEIEHYKDDYYDVDLVKYKMNNEIYENIKKNIIYKK